MFDNLFKFKKNVSKPLSQKISIATNKPKLMKLVNYRYIDNSGSIRPKGIYFDYTDNYSYIIKRLDKDNWLYLDSLIIVHQLTKNPEFKYSNQNIFPTNQEKLAQLKNNLKKINYLVLKKSRDELISKIVNMGVSPIKAVELVDKNL